ncbi:MAG: DUF4397 domain-containing protein, partial [Roseiflexaceae bacterium]|nr:DUF4397 domain-containing protein [Roseiflexaceae bacterium]
TTTATLAAGQVATAWANGLLSGSGAQAFKVTPTIDAQASGVARIRILHGAPDAPSVDVFIDQLKVVSNVAFGQLSSYLPVNAGTFRVQIRAAGAATVVFETSITTGAGKDYTIAAIGLIDPQGAAIAAGEFTLVAFEDMNGSAPAGQAKLRVIHLSPNAPTIDVRAGTAVLFDDLTYPNASDRYQTVAPGAVEARVTTADGQQTLLATPLTLAPGSVSTVFALGLAGDSVPENQRLRALAVTDTPSIARIFVPILSR